MVLVLSHSWFLLMPLSVLLCAGSVVFRFAVAHGEQRQQLKWVVCAVGLIGVGFALLAPAALWETRFPALFSVSYAIAANGLVALPVTIAIAVLRYRLYAIDLILNRAALYGALTVVLGAAFLLATGLSQYAVEALTGHRSDLLPAANGVLVALAFQPVRRRPKNRGRSYSAGARGTRPLFWRYRRIY
jgi:hypothetical protein